MLSMCVCVCVCVHVCMCVCVGVCVCVYATRRSVERKVAHAAQLPSSSGHPAAAGEGQAGRARTLVPCALRPSSYRRVARLPTGDP